MVYSITISSSTPESSVTVLVIQGLMTGGVEHAHAHIALETGSAGGPRGGKSGVLRREGDLLARLTFRTSTCKTDKKGISRGRYAELDVVVVVVVIPFDRIRVGISSPSRL